MLEQLSRETVMLASVTFTQEQDKTTFPNGNDPTRSSCETFQFAIGIRRNTKGGLIVPQNITKNMLPGYLKEKANREGILVTFYKGQIIPRKPIAIKKESLMSKKAFFKCTIVAIFHNREPEKVEYEARIPLSCMPVEASQKENMQSLMEAVRSFPMCFIKNCPSAVSYADSIDVKDGVFSTT